MRSRFQTESAFFVSENEHKKLFFILMETAFLKAKTDE